jgi:Malectin domain
MSSPAGRDLDGDTFASERKELEAVLASGIFGPSSNAAKLLRYICDRYFQDATEAINEYDVGVHALGRRSNFDPQTDSIVRVEVHRVRKRLQEYYSTDGAAHPVKIVIARGRYAPQFVRSEPIEADSSETGAGNAEALSTVESRPIWDLVRAHRWGVLAGALILTAGLAAGLSRLAPGRASKQHVVAPSAAAAPGSDTIRILAGLTSGEYVDRFGNHWSADRYFTGGTAGNVRYVSLSLADDPGIYQHFRAGEEFTYDIPLQSGFYEMRLMFAESAGTPILGSIGDGVRAFHVDANGVRVVPPLDGRHMQQMDVVADAGGLEMADVKVVKNLSPAGDGRLHLRFAARNQRAFVNAIEIVPGLKGKMRPLRFRAHDGPYTDSTGNLWLADRYYRGGRLSRFRATVAHTADPALYEGERFGSFTYSVPVAADTTYTVQLHFAENYFGGFAAKLAHPRIFNVFANHAQVLKDFDITRDAGAAVTAVVKTFRGIRPNVFDKIVLNFEPSTEFAIVNAISVEDEAK